MDKQALKKHHFWILLGLAVVLIPIALSGAVFGVGGAAEDKDKKNHAKLTALQKTQVKPDDYRTKLEKLKGELQARKNVVWQQAYQAQEGLIHWPDALKHLDSLYFGDSTYDDGGRDRSKFVSNEVYLAEYNRLPEIIAPTQFPGHRWQEVLRPVEWKLLPTWEESWLALEDLCVEREVLRDIHAVNQMIAEFLPDPQPPKVPAKPPTSAAGDIKHYQDEMVVYAKAKSAYDAAKRKVDDELKTAYKVASNEFAGRFISPYWQLDLIVGKPTAGRAGEMRFRGKLTNTSGRRQNVAQIEFKVWLRNPNRGVADPIVVPVQAEYLADKASVDFDTTRPGIADAPLTIYKVEQKLDPRYAPVKEVVKLELGKLSQRFADKGLTQAAFSEEEVKKNPPAPAPVAPGAAPGAPGANAPDTTITPNGIQRNRYLERTEQVRRMPVAIVMIVDESHIQDVLRALANSRLRFQNTQIHYKRFRDVLVMDNPGAGEAPAAIPVPGRGGPGAFEPGRMRGREPRGGPAAHDRGRPFGGEAGGNPAADDEASANLVELTVYGLISLYERYPPKTPVAGAPGAPGQLAPAAPGVPPAPGVPVPPPPVGAPIPPPAGAPGGNLPPPAPTTGNPTANPPASPTTPPAPTAPKPPAP